MKALSMLILRRPLFFAALTLMLAVAAAFMSVGVSAYIATSEQLAEINAAYTTIAVPYNNEYPHNMPHGGKDGHDYYPLDDVLARCPYVLGQDKRAILGASVHGMNTLQITDYMPVYYDSTYSFADDFLGSMILSVRCIDANEIIHENSGKETRDGKSWVEYEYKDKYGNYSFSVVEPICIMDGFANPVGEVTIYTHYSNSDGSPLFEEGKTYLVRGHAEHDPYLQSWLGNDYIILQLSQGLANNFIMSGRVEGKDGIRYIPIPEDELPLYAEYEGDVHDFLASDEGKVWREEIIPAYEATYRSVKFMPTDNINAIYQFNTGAASLVDGRLFTYDEYQSGAKVCIVGQTYAEHNGLKVGDTLTMDLYVPDVGASTAYSDGSDNTFITMNPLYSADLLKADQEYEIVGIYTAPSSPLGAYAFGPNMVFAPKSSVPEVKHLSNAQDMQYRKMPIANTVILKYGTTELFEEYMAENGWGGCFIYSDQGYSKVGEALQAALVSALRLLIVSAAVFVVVLCVYLYLVSNRVKPSLRTMRVIGVSKGRCFLQSFAAMVALLLLAIALGGLLGGLLFDRVSGAVVSDLIHFSPRVAAVCGAAQFGVLAVCEAVCLAALCRKDLMNRKQV